MYILTLCSTSDELALALSRLAGKVNIIQRITGKDIDEIRTLDDLGVYRMIVISSINWRLPYSCAGLARHFRERFRGPIVAIGDQTEWRNYMKAGGCDHALPNDHKAAEFLYNLLFPPDPPTAST